MSMGANLVSPLLSKWIKFEDIGAGYFKVGLYRRTLGNVAEVPTKTSPTPECLIAEPLPIIDAKSEQADGFTAIQPKPSASIDTSAVVADDAVRPTRAKLTLEFGREVDSADGDLFEFHLAIFDPSFLKGHEDVSTHVNEWLLVQRGMEALYPPINDSFERQVLEPRSHAT